MSACGNATFTGHLAGNLQYGVRYKPALGVDFVSEHDFTSGGGLTGSISEAEASISCWLFPKLFVKIEFVGGPTFGLKASLGGYVATGDNERCPNGIVFGSFIGFQASVGAKVDVEIAGKALLNRTFGPLTFLTLQYPIFDYCTTNDKPAMKPLRGSLSPARPGTGTVYGGSFFAFTTPSFIAPAVTNVSLQFVRDNAADLFIAFSVQYDDGLRCACQRAYTLTIPSYPLQDGALASAVSGHAVDFNSSYNCAQRSSLCDDQMAWYLEPDDPAVPWNAVNVYPVRNGVVSTAWVGCICPATAPQCSTVPIPISDRQGGKLCWLGTSTLNKTDASASARRYLLPALRAR